MYLIEGNQDQRDQRITVIRANIIYKKTAHVKQNYIRLGKKGVIFNLFLKSFNTNQKETIFTTRYTYTRTKMTSNKFTTLTRGLLYLLLLIQV